MRRLVNIAALTLGTLFMVAACGEKPQVAEPGARRADAKASTGGQAAYNAPGWKPGDEADWQRQIAQRAQAQNEYARTGAKK